MDVRFFYRWREGDGELSGGWTLESGEARVLLLACLDARDASTVKRAMATAAAVAGVLLVEAEDGEPTSSRGYRGERSGLARAFCPEVA
jgi:hypothetical protein